MANSKITKEIKTVTFTATTDADGVASVSNIPDAVQNGVILGVRTSGEWNHIRLYTGYNSNRIIVMDYYTDTPIKNTEFTFTVAYMGG